jgi:hypothetical protein
MTDTHRIYDREDQVACVSFLHELARHHGPQADVVQVDPVEWRDSWPHRGEGVETLAEGELAQRRLELARRPLTSLSAVIPPIPARAAEASAR